MPSLRTLLSDLEPASIGNPQRVLHVYSTNESDQQSGGCCCLWTAPAGVTKVTFEMWGAGGDGQGARCCESPGTMPTNGSYALKTIDTVAGCQYRLCAGGSGCFGCCCGIGVRAFPSYIVDITASSTIACATGGCGGCSQFIRGSFMNGYMCCWGLMSGNGSLGDITMEGTGGSAIRSQYCYQHFYNYTSGGIGADRKTAAVCAKEMTLAGCSINCSPPSRGGSGNPGRACGGGFCRGQHGGNGAIKISYS